MTWTSSRDGVPEWHVQHTVYEESTGDRVAIVFQSESNVALVTAAPALLAYGLEALRVLESSGLGDTFEARGLRRALDEATAAPV